MEHRLYCDSPYASEWQADIDSIGQKDEKYLVTLSETAFYPGGGGQPSDKGTVDGIAIEDVYESDGRIYHVLGRSPERKTVTCKLDFSRRFDLMQQHTGQHLLSAVLFKLYACRTSSLHMGMDESSIDVELADMPVQMLTAVEDSVNEHIYRDLPITTTCVMAEEASELALRKTPPKEGEVRIVEISTIDRSPCCGTHLRRTGEIGIVKIVKTEKRGQETRVYFKCGMRALKDYRLKQDTVAGLVRLYRMSENEVLQKTEAMAAQLKHTQKELAELKGRILEAEARAMTDTAHAKLIEKTFSDRSFEDIGTLANHIFGRGDFMVLLASIPDKRLLFAHHGKFDVDCGRILKEHLPAFNGKGGGKASWANGGFTTVEEMNRFKAFLLEKLSKNG